MKVYLAATFEQREVLAQRRIDLHKHGIECTAEWLDEEDIRTCDAAYWKAIAQRDIRNIRAADVFVIDVTTPSPRGGMNIEYGTAVEMGKVIVVLGPPCSHFHYLADYTCGTWAQVLLVLDALRQFESKQP